MICIKEEDDQQVKPQNNTAVCAPTKSTNELRSSGMLSSNSNADGLYVRLQMCDEACQASCGCLSSPSQTIAAQAQLTVC
jgi:hypothetical protein